MWRTLCAVLLLVRPCCTELLNLYFLQPATLCPDTLLNY